MFALTCNAEDDLDHLFSQLPIRRSLMSHALRRMQRPNMAQVAAIKADELASFWRSERLPTPSQQADALITWIGDHQPTSFDLAEIHRAALAATIGLQISAHDDSGGFAWLNSQLESMRLYESAPRGNNILALRLTMAGWEKHEKLRKTSAESRIAFMAMKFDQPDLNRVVDECFRLAVRRTGFELRVLTDQQPAGIIDDQMRAAILSSRFVISDLTHRSPGAYWEAGFGEGLGLPVIYTCEKSVWQKERTHFDTNHLVTRTWELTNLKKAENELVATIRATLRTEAKQTDD